MIRIDPIAAILFAALVAMPAVALDDEVDPADKSPVLNIGVTRNRSKIGAMGLKYGSQRIWLLNNGALIVGVVGVINGGPADLAGIRAGDQIMAINGVAVDRLTTIALRNLMEDEPGTVAHFTIRRHGRDMNVDVMRILLETMPDESFRETFVNQRNDNGLKLAYFYFRQGNFEEAAKAYRKVLETAPEGKEKQLMINAVMALEDEIDHWSVAKCNPQADNYLDESTQNGYSRWRATDMPLRVYIADGSSLPNFHPIVTRMLHRSFDEWSAASGGRLRFEYVQDPKSCDIECLWTNDSSLLSNPLEGGDARVLGFGPNITHAVIRVLLSGKNDERISASEAKAVALHEIGHALGLIGHTRHAGDSMFISATNVALSARDKKTIADLYGLEDAVLAAKPQKRLR